MDRKRQGRQKRCLGFVQGGHLNLMALTQIALGEPA
jgi:hypothetical protein